MHNLTDNFGNGPAPDIQTDSCPMNRKMQSKNEIQSEIRCQSKETSNIDGTRIRRRKTTQHEVQFPEQWGSKETNYAGLFTAPAWAGLEMEHPLRSNKNRTKMPQMRNNTKGILTKIFENTDWTKASIMPKAYWKKLTRPVPIALKKISYAGCIGCIKKTMHQFPKM